MKDTTLGNITRQTICERADVLRAYGVFNLDASVRNRLDAIASVVRQWERGDFSDCFPTVQATYDVANFEQSEVLRDLIASDLAMQLNRMACYLSGHGLSVEAGYGSKVHFERNGEFFYVSGKTDMILTDPAGEKTSVKIVGKCNYSASARKPENLPENAPEIAWLTLANPEVTNAAIYALSHKDDTSSKFAEEYDVAVGKNGKILTGKNIVSVNLDRESAKSVLAGSISSACEAPDCDKCDCRELCKGNFSFRNRVGEAEMQKKVFQWTEEQETVIGQKGGNMAVLAGPGSGKTAVLVERYVRLVESGISPSNILLLVFTNKVADEIRQRIAAQLGLDRNERNALNVMTINAFGQKLINDNPSAFGGRLVVADSGERKRLLREILFPPTEDGSGLMVLRHKYRNLYGDHYGLSDLDRLCEKLDGGADAESLKLSEEDYAEAVRVNAELHARLEQMNAITYDKQVALPLAWLTENGAMAKAYANLFRYVMVDEAQDLDEKQYHLIRILASLGNLMMVGDDDQSIYRFRKGSAKYLLSFAKEKGTQVVILHDNFRASEYLNGVGNLLISKSVEERQKKAYRYKTKGRKPELCIGREVLPDVVSQLLSEGNRPCDIAILARTNKTLESVSESLKDIVPTANSKDYIREDAVFLFFRAALDVVLHGYDADGMSKYRFWRAFSDVPIGPITMLPEEVLAKAEVLRNDILLYPVEQALEAFVESDLPAIPTTHPVLSMIKEWCETKNLNEETLFDFLSQMIRLADETRIDYGADEDKVQLFTAHDSKGKEFPIVIVADAEAYEDEEGSSEELRLLYVAMTRAKEWLILVGKECDKPYFAFLKGQCELFETRRKEGGAA